MRVFVHGHTFVQLETAVLQKFTLIQHGLLPKRTSSSCAHCETSSYFVLDHGSSLHIMKGFDRCKRCYPPHFNFPFLAAPTRWQFSSTCVPVSIRFAPTFSLTQLDILRKVLRAIFMSLHWPCFMDFRRSLALSKNSIVACLGS